MNLKKAKRIFFEYDGSKFYMSRSWDYGIEETYRRMKVPKSLEEKWLEELTTLKLKKLGSRENWWVIQFLVNHRDKRHLDAVASAKPLGVFSDKLNFLEFLLKYVELCRDRYSATRLGQVCDDVQQQAHLLRRRVRAKSSVSSVDQLIHAAKKLADDICRS